MKREMLFVTLLILLPFSTLCALKFFIVSWDRTLTASEGSDVLLQCRPGGNVSKFTLRLANGYALHPDVKFTADPKRGILIHSVQLNQSGKYKCSANIDSVPTLSPEFSLTIKKRHRPLQVNMGMDEYVGVVGETLQIPCYTENTDYFFSVTWRHSSNKSLQISRNSSETKDGVQITSVVTFPAVNKSDAGNLTCICKNNAGEFSSTASLRIVESPYVLLTPLLKSDGSDWVVELLEGETLTLRVGVDAHPSVKKVWWETPQLQNSSAHQETFTRIHRSHQAEASLLLKRITAEESGWYVINTQSASVNASARFKVYVFYKPNVVLQWANGFLTCSVSGYPTPTITWYHCERLNSTYDECYENQTSTQMLPVGQLEEEFEPQHVESVLLAELNPDTVVLCVAENLVGEQRSSSYTIQSAAVKHTILRTSLTVDCAVSVTAALLLILLAVCVYMCKKKPRYEIRWKIIEVNNGNDYSYVDPTQLPYNTQWEFPRDQLTFGQVLGAGAFGKVVEAAAYGLEKEDLVTRVAVKMLKSSAHSEEKEALMSELKILSHLGTHANIVNLLGACTRGGPVLVITEYCGYGDLLNFLRRRASLFINSYMFDTQHPASDYKNLPDLNNKQQGNPRNSGYMDMQQAQRTEATQKKSATFNIKDLLRFSNQVAQGMDFLSSRNCIHRDVAARNVLITDSLVAKICDFGLARDIMHDSNYVVRGNARLPVKWMSPESIFQCLYTVQSDVWSYGVLLWEIFSLGRSPYPDVKVDARFYEMIKSGHHMSQPDFAPAEMYGIMKMCWNLEPTTRPTFNQIVQIINKLLPDERTPERQYINPQQKLLTMESEEKAETNQESCDHTAEEQHLLTNTNNYQTY